MTIYQIRVIITLDKNVVLIIKKIKKMENLTEREAMSLIDRVGPSLGYDNTYNPVFPKGRTDVCVVVRLAENGTDYGFDTVYLVWKESDGSIKHKEIKNSRSTKDYINVSSVEIKEDGSVSVSFGSGGSYSGVPWSESMKIAITSDSSKDSKIGPNSYAELVKQAMAKVVENHQHKHPLYQSTAIKEFVINEEHKIAVFVLFEQIDTDRNTEVGEGWLGDQFRYSLWKMNGKKPVQLYEDHAYIRSRSISATTGTRGQECSLKNLKLEDKTIKVTHLKGRVEELVTEELTFSL